MARFTDIDLAALPAPNALAPLDYEGTVAVRISNLRSDLADRGFVWDTYEIQTDPLVIQQQHAAYYEINKTAEINDAVKSTLLAFAQGSDLDHKAAELGVERKVIVEANPEANPPIAEVLETDAALRARRQLAPEALSTAGPPGAYKSFALKAHPHVSDCAEFDPHSGLCDPGEVLLVIASSIGDGVPTDLVLDSVAEYLDARTIRYAVTAERTRTITRKQNLRPLTDKVIIEACSAVECSISAVLKLRSGPSPETVVEEAERRLDGYIRTRREIGMMISDSAVAAAVHISTIDGVTAVEDADITLKKGEDVVDDLTVGVKEMIVITSISITYEIVA